MTKLHFHYSMKLFYTEPVDPCYFTIKCLPKNTERQKLVNINIDMDPRARYSQSSDGFGNDKIIGAVRQPHDHYYLDVTGEVEIHQLLYEELAVPEKIGMYKYSYGKTWSGEGLKGYANKLAEELKSQNLYKVYDKAINVMHIFYRDFKYDTTATDINTSAEEAFTMGRGVCQDYAHIYICLLRLLGIPARYVTGLMIGEGQSHAWVEFLNNDKWIGLDPTNDLLIDDNYIKLGHGRDASDCTINLGIMRGGGDQRQEIEVKVWKDTNIND